MPPLSFLLFLSPPPPFRTSEVPFPVPSLSRRTQRATVSLPPHLLLSADADALPSLSCPLTAPSSLRPSLLPPTSSFFPFLPLPFCSAFCFSFLLSPPLSPFSLSRLQSLTAVASPLSRPSLSWAGGVSDWSAQWHLPMSLLHAGRCCYSATHADTKRSSFTPQTHTHTPLPHRLVRCSFARVRVSTPPYTAPPLLSLLHTTSCWSLRGNRLAAVSACDCAALPANRPACPSVCLLCSSAHRCTALPCTALPTPASTVLRGVRARSAR